MPNGENTEGRPLQITQVRSVIGRPQDQRRTVRSLGLRRIHHTVTQPDRPEIRGMVAKVAHLVEVRYGDAVVALEPGQEPSREAAERREDAVQAPAGSARPEEVVQRSENFDAAGRTERPEAPGSAIDVTVETGVDTDTGEERE